MTDPALVDAAGQDVPVIVPVPNLMEGCTGCVMQSGFPSRVVHLELHDNSWKVRCSRNHGNVVASVSALPVGADLIAPRFTCDQAENKSVVEARVFDS